MTSPRHHAEDITTSALELIAAVCGPCMDLTSGARSRVCCAAAESRQLVLWRHCHEEPREVHTRRHGQNDHGRIATMVIIGDTFHNCVDGVIIAGAFLVSIELGIITALAIITHEVPQEVGDFLVLLHSGYSKRQALGFNLVASGAMVVGGVFAYYALQTMHQFIPPLLGIAAASMLYVSVADLIPGLHRRRGLRATVQQALLIAAGIGTIWVVGRMATSLAGV
ncbi:MAG: ZIP family metal transporter [Pseudomonadota bacterium]